MSNFKHRLSLLNRFFINNELFEIEPVFINNLIKINKLNEINTVIYLLGPKSFKKANCKQYINSDRILTTDSKDQIIKIKRLLLDIIKKTKT